MLLANLLSRPLLAARVVLGTLMCWPVAAVGAAETVLDELRVVRILPRTESEVAQAHERSRGNSCETVLSGEPLEMNGFVPCLTDRDRAEWERGKLLWPSSRRHICSVGLEMLASDKRNLPTVSSGQILRYIGGHYVAVQARVQKDPGTGELFLHHRPLAVTASFGRGALTEEFTDPVLIAVRDFHSLGVYLPGSSARRARNLRTLVLTFRKMIVGGPEAGGKPLLKPNHEFLFVRGRETGTGNDRRMELYAFATSDFRQRLHFLEPWTLPTAPQHCGIRATVLFTEYTTLGLIPSKSATRDVAYRSRSSFELVELDQFARQSGWRGDALDNLDATLDAILDGKLKP